MQTTKQLDDKFFSKLISKECSITNPSFRVYYGGVSGSVPFMWESQPGTPKHKFCDNSVPPLTPPPSYYTTGTHNEKPIKKHSRSKLLHTLFLRINIKKGHMPSSPSLSSSLSSSSWSSSSSSHSTSTASNVYRRRRFLSVGSSFDGDHEEVSNESRNSMLCFEINRDKSGGVIRGCYSGTRMKKALLSMVGRGSG